MTEKNVASEEAEIKTTANDNIVQLSLVEKQKASSDLLTIVVEGGSLSDNVRSAERALARATRRDAGNGVYQLRNDDTLCRASRTPAPEIPPKPYGTRGYREGAPAGLGQARRDRRGGSAGRAARR